MELKDQGALMSIKPRYAEKIFLGEKLVELRKVVPRSLDEMVIVYESSPVMAITGAFCVDQIVVKKTMELWPDVHDKACVSWEEYIEYFTGKEKAIGLYIKDPVKFRGGLSLETLRDEIDFRPPQSFQYIDIWHNPKLYKLLERMWERI